LENNDPLVDFIIDGILDKKGREVIFVDFNDMEYAPCSGFIVCHGDSCIQGKALAGSIERKVKENLGLNVWHKEGENLAQWILLDYGNIIVHIFQKEYRDYYRLEELWGDAVIKTVEEKV